MAKPIYVFDGTEWQIIGPQVSEAPISVQATAPTSPQTGDMWIDTSEVVPTIDPATLATQSDISTVQASLSSVEAIAMLGL
jgi:hypothetical protein